MSMTVDNTMRKRLVNGISNINSLPFIYSLIIHDMQINK